MKSEIDLRPREFIQARLYPKRLLAAGFLAVAAAGTVLLCFALIGQHIGRITREVIVLRQTNRELATRAAPLAQLEAELRVLQDRAALQAAIKEQNQPWSDNLRSIEAALPENFRLNSLSVDRQGQLTLSGNGPALQEIASYNQALQRMSFIYASTVSRIDLDATGYRFVIQATLEEGSVDTYDGS